MSDFPVDSQLVAKLTTILEQAKSGELVGFAAVTFKNNGGPDQWAWLTRHEDIDRVPSELEALKPKNWPESN